MSLTAAAIRNLSPQEKPQKLFDAGGLFLLVSPTGGKWWRLKYRFAGREKLLSLGTYPDVGLKDARERRDEARRQLASRIDPAEHRKAAKSAKRTGATNSFEVVAREWIVKYTPSWAASHESKVSARLERDIFPWIGARPVGEITPARGAFGASSNRSTWRARYGSPRPPKLRTSVSVCRRDRACDARSMH